MARFKHPLDHVQVAAPCKADWNQMIGSERVRFCGQCNLNVFNLSGMSRFEAESLIAGTEGRLCVRFYRRFDGSMITQDCPVGLRAIQRRVSYLTKAILAAGFTFLASIGMQSLIPGFAMRDPQVFSGIMLRPQSVITSPHLPPPTSGRVTIRRQPQPGQRKTK
jgi:hypothetical protein